jgi:hypothetical protein
MRFVVYVSKNVSWYVQNEFYKMLSEGFASSWNNASLYISYFLT